MKNRNFYTLLLASMLLTFSAQAQDFDISLPKATVLHQNASGSFNNFWGADATGYLSSMDQWNNNPHRFPWPWFISPTLSFSRGLRMGLETPVLPVCLVWPVMILITIRLTRVLEPMQGRLA